MGALPTRTLGTTGMEISRVGLGAWAMGGGDWRYAWGHQDDTESVATVRRAVEAGVNWVDTAAVYGAGHSERVVGRALATMPEADRPFVFTKCGLVWNDGDPSASPYRVMTPDSVRREVEGSLRRLGVGRIDLFQVHWPATGGPLEYTGDGRDAVAGSATPLEEYWKVMADLRAEGKVRAIGLSNHDLGQLKRAHEVTPVESFQPPFSAINRSNAEEVAWCARNAVGVITYSPMQSGLLTGAFSRERVAGLPGNDWRRGHVDFTRDLTANLSLVDAMRPVARRHDTTLAAVAVAWTLGWPGVTGTIVGARRPGQIDGWLPGATLRLDAEDLDEIARATEASGVGEGPVRHSGT